MVNLQLGYASRTAQQASQSSEPAQSVASLPMTRVERRTSEEPFDTHRTWEPPDDAELAQNEVALQPNVRDSSEEESGTSHQFQEHPEPSEHGSVSQPEEEVTTEALAQEETTAPTTSATGQEPSAPPDPEPQAQPVPTSPTRESPQCQRPLSLNPKPQWPTQPHQLHRLRTPPHRSKPDHDYLHHCLAHTPHSQQSQRQCQSLLSINLSPRSTTWTRISRRISFSLPTMRRTQQPQPQRVHPCHQPYAVPGLQALTYGG